MYSEECFKNKYPNESKNHEDNEVNKYEEKKQGGDIGHGNISHEYQEHAKEGSTTADKIQICAVENTVSVAENN